VVRKGRVEDGDARASKGGKVAATTVSYVIVAGCFLAVCLLHAHEFSSSWLYLQTLSLTLQSPQNRTAPHGKL
jgi:hypothetical protein